jgi:sugar O-acyltransferase (sialic acid O-acetyltransferase NeuD family)
VAATGYIIGAGPQGRILAEIWQIQCPGIELHFLDDNADLHGSHVLGVPVDGSVDRLSSVDLTAAEIVLAVGENHRRLELAAAWDKRGVRWATVVHPSAVLMPSATIGAGSVVFPHALVHTGARVGRHVIINSGALVEHDAVVDDGVSISPGVTMGGRVHIGRATFISTGAALGPRVSIGAGTIVGAGAVVVSDLPDGVLAYGVPARVVRKLEGASDFRRVL